MTMNQPGALTVAHIETATTAREWAVLRCSEWEILGGAVKQLAAHALEAKEAG